MLIEVWKNCLVNHTESYIEVIMFSIHPLPMFCSMPHQHDSCISPTVQALLGRGCWLKLPFLLAQTEKHLRIQIVAVLAFLHPGARKNCCPFEESLFLAGERRSVCLTSRAEPWCSPEHWGQHWNSKQGWAILAPPAWCPGICSCSPCNSQAHVP